jgi:hypothetical protein
LRINCERWWAVYKVLPGTASPGAKLGELLADDMTAACACAFLRFPDDAEIGIVVLEKKEA